MKSVRGTVIGMAGALALTACSPSQSGSNASSQNGTQSGGGQDQPPPDNLMEDPQNGAVPVTLPPPVPVSTIPAAFRGRWGAVATDCVAAPGTAKNLLVVEASSLTTGGTRAAAGSLRTIGGDMLLTELTSSGSQRRPNRLTLIDLGRTLVRQEQNPPNAIRYSRCPAQ